MSSLLFGWLKKVGVKALAGLSGPIGWAASLFFDRLLKYLGELAAKGWAATKDWLGRWKKTKTDEGNAETYNTTLQDGANEQTQVDASIDLLNGRKRD